MRDGARAPARGEAVRKRWFDGWYGVVCWRSLLGRWA